MRSRSLEELRKIHTEINEKSRLGSGTDRKENETMLWETVNEMMKLCYLARKEGLLALEEAVLDIPSENVEEALKQLIFLLVDGTDPQVLEEIGLSRYYTRLYTDYEALRYFIYLEGALSIQAGENPRILEERLKVMLPADMYLKYSYEQERIRQEKEHEKEEHLIENLCKGERCWNPGESGYYVFKLLDYVICDMSDMELQRMMREVDNTTLSLAMKGMSGEARKRIFANLSQRLAKLVAEDMIHMGPVRMVDVLEASQQMLNVIVHLVDTGEIVGNYDYLEPFYSVFSVDTKQQRQKNGKLDALKNMVEEYEKGSQLVREVTE